MAIVYEDIKNKLTVELENNEHVNILSNNSNEKIIIKNDNGELILDNTIRTQTYED